MKCADLGPQLTAYLDGELDGDRGTAVRGHLRTCDGCRALASREAALRDALRELPAVEPPASMWAGVQARLAASEVAESERPGWRRAVSRWTSVLDVAWLSPRYLAGGVVVAALTLVLVVHARHPGAGTRDGGEGAQILAHAIDLPSPVLGASASQRPQAPGAGASLIDGTDGTDGDVTAALAAEPAHVTATYAATADELVELALEVRATWSDAQRVAYDDKLGALRTEVAHAVSDRDRQRTYRALIRFVQGALVRDDITLASTGRTP